MTWKLRKKDSRCASISVTKEQEVWGEYGIYTAHKHTYLFKLIHKRHLKAPKKRSKRFPKATPDTTRNQKITQTLPGPKKPILGGRVPHRARQKDAKVNL